MRIREISRSDIINGKLWKVINSESDIVHEWEIKEVKRIADTDIIFHSSVLVGLNRIYLALVSKYYEDGGEVGEYLVFENNEWKHLGVDIVDIEESTEGPYLSHISTLDIHEFQGGSFDNRKEHKLKFDFYISQIGSNKIQKFPTRKNVLPKKVQNMSTGDLLRYLYETSYKLQALSDLSKVAKYNKLAARVSEVINHLKNNRNAHNELKEILFSENAYLAGWVAYSIVDIYERDCLKVIKRIARSKSADAIMADFWLKEYKKKHKKWLIWSLKSFIFACCTSDN